MSAANGQDHVWDIFADHSGAARRISHIGIGLNPALHQPLDWLIIDEHIAGMLFVAFGENRYMGGKNASSLNIDFTVPQATISIDGKRIVEGGQLAQS